MKLSPIFALLVVCAPVAAHAQTADVPAVAALPMAPKSAATADAFVWRFAPPVGSHWTMRSFKRVISIGTDNIIGGPVMPLTNEQSIGSQIYRTTDIHSFSADYDVLSRDKFGATTIRLTFRELLDYIDIAAVGTGNFNSTTPGGACLIDGATLTFKRGPDGRIWSVVGTRSFKRRYLQSNGMTDENTLRQTLDSQKAPRNEDVAEYVNQQASEIPAFPLRVGEKWAETVGFPTLPDFKLSGTGTLKTLDEKFASIASSASFNGSDPKQKLIVTRAAGVNYSRLIGTINGTTRIERASGLALETDVNTVLKGSITGPLRGNVSVTAQATPVNVTSTTRVVLVPR